MNPKRNVLGFEIIVRQFLGECSTAEQSHQVLNIMNFAGQLTSVNARHQVLRTLRRSVPRVSALLSEQPDLGWNVTARRVCEAFGFVDAWGRVQQPSCIKALRTLDAEGVIELPAAKQSGPTPKPRLLESGIFIRIRPEAGERVF